MAVSGHSWRIAAKTCLVGGLLLAVFLCLQVFAGDMHWVGHGPQQYAHYLRTFQQPNAPTHFPIIPQHCDELLYTYFLTDAGTMPIEPIVPMWFTLALVKTSAGFLLYCLFLRMKVDPVLSLVGAAFLMFGTTAVNPAKYLMLFDSSNPLGYVVHSGRLIGVVMTLVLLVDMLDPGNAVPFKSSFGPVFFVLLAAGLATTSISNLMLLATTCATAYAALFLDRRVLLGRAHLRSDRVLLWKPLHVFLMVAAFLAPAISYHLLRHAESVQTMALFVLAGTTIVAVRWLLIRWLHGAPFHVNHLETLFVGTPVCLGVFVTAVAAFDLYFVGDILPAGACIVVSMAVLALLLWLMSWTLFREIVGGGVGAFLFAPLARRFALLAMVALFSLTFAANVFCSNRVSRSALGYLHEQGMLAGVKLEMPFRSLRQQPSQYFCDAREKGWLADGPFNDYCHDGHHFLGVYGMIYLMAGGAYLLLWSNLKPAELYSREKRLGAPAENGRSNAAPMRIAIVRDCPLTYADSCEVLSGNGSGLTAVEMIGQGAVGNASPAAAPASAYCRPVAALGATATASQEECLLRPLIPGVYGLEAVESVPRDAANTAREPAGSDLRWVLVLLVLCGLLPLFLFEMDFVLNVSRAWVKSRFLEIPVYCLLFIFFYAVHRAASPRLRRAVLVGATMYVILPIFFTDRLVQWIDNARLLIGLMYQG